jgi:hypothetical protein
MQVPRLVGNVNNVVWIVLQMASQVPGPEEAETAMNGHIQYFASNSIENCRTATQAYRSFAEP